MSSEVAEPGAPASDQVGCALCDRAVTTADWCAGCASHICQACDALLTVREARVRHPPLMHLAWIHDQVEEQAAAIVRALREQDARRTWQRFVLEVLVLVAVGGVAVAALLWRGRLCG